MVYIVHDFSDEEGYEEKAPYIYNIKSVSQRPFKKAILRLDWSMENDSAYTILANHF